MLNSERRQGATARLANWTGASLATAKGWQTDEASDHHRNMSATAQRLLSLLAYLHAEGTLDEAMMERVKEVEAHLVAGQGRLDRFLEQLTGRRIEPDEDSD